MEKAYEIVVELISDDAPLAKKYNNFLNKLT